MYLEWIQESSLYPILRDLDHQLAAQARKAGCPFCAGKLHRADYPRKPRGGPLAEDPVYWRRHSFCCATEGCRRRTTPASVLFLGRKVYFAAVVVLASCLRQGPRPERLARLEELTGASARTLRRWLKWWRTSFVHSDAWRATGGRRKTPVDAAQLPRSLLASFLGPAQSRLVALLRFLGPWTSRSAAGGQVF